VPTVTVRRRSAPSPVDEGLCADGPDIWPSAHGLAVGTLSFSRSVGQRSACLTMLLI
jgi:hypothetical protein